MCSTSGDGVMTSANQCPTVTFTVHGTGFVSYAGGKENFTWALKNSILSISHAVKKPGNIFSDTSYTASFEKSKDWVELLIRDIPNDINYYLSKRLSNTELNNK